jgi:hypothetical protein
MRDADVRGIVEWRVVVAVVACSMLLALPMAAQDEPMGEGAMAQEGAMPEMSPEEQAMMEAWMQAGTPGPQHAALAEHAGDYTMVIKSWMDPAGEPMVSEGTAHSEMILGGRIYKETVESDMMGMPFTGLGFTGYDNTTGKYWGTWMDSMSTGLGIGEGEWDEEADALKMAIEFADPMTKETKTAHTVTRWTDDGKTVFEWYEDRDGAQVKTMEIVYTPE